MPPEQPNANQREFRCIHCHGKILVPRDLPPTTGPCPHCEKEITSPGPSPDPEPEVDPIFGKPVQEDAAGATTPPPPSPSVAEIARRAEEKAAAEEAERKAAEEAERKAAEEAERKAAEEAERKAAEEAERKAAEEVERKAAEEAERKAAEEAQRKAAEEAERKAAEKAKRKAAEEAERKAAEEAERKAAEEAERKAAEEAQRKAAEEAERNVAEEAKRKAVEEAERKAAEEAERKVTEEAQRKAAQEAERKAAEEAELEAAEEAKRKAVEEAERQAVEEAERSAAEDARRQAEEERRRRELAERQAEAANRQQAGSVAPMPPMDAADPAPPPAEPEREGVSSPRSEPAAAPAPSVENPLKPTKEATAPGKGKSPGNRRKGRFPVAAVVVLLVLLAIGGGGFLAITHFMSKDGPAPPTVNTNAAAQREMHYLEKGWEEDAFQTLDRFLAARRPAGKAAYSINGSGLLGKMEAFYQGAPIDDSDTPAEAFSVFDYPQAMEDRKRGIFMLTYDQPPVFEIDEFFAPLAPLDVQYKLREPDMLLAAVARSSNFSAEPLKVHVLFRRTPEGLRIDWETFVQTKHRTLRDFLELPVAGHSEVFRVILSETMPEKRAVPAGHRTYLVSDPAYRREDSTRVNVPVDSEVGRALSILNWRGARDRRAISKTATIELRWTREETPQLEISRFLCWEFLGVGGEAVERSE